MSCVWCGAFVRARGRRYVIYKTVLTVVTPSIAPAARASALDHFQFFFFFFHSTYRFQSCLEDEWGREQHRTMILLLWICITGICFDASLFGWFSLFFSLPVLVTWLLPVAGTTYKLVVIKVFDLLWFPVEAHTFPDWRTLCCCHCDQWVTMQREPQSDRAEIEHGEGSGMAEW